MNPVPNRDFLEVHTMHQHQPHCKQQCFVFTEIADIELPPDLTGKFGSEKLKNATAAGDSLGAYSKESSCGELPAEHKTSSRGRKVIIICLITLVCIAMAGGIPLALQLRSSSLLEARLAFIRRLLTEAPLIEGSWRPTRDLNNTLQVVQVVRQNYIGAVLWPIEVPCGAQYLDAVQLALEGIDEARRLTASTEMHIVESADEMEQSHMRGEVAVLIGIDGGHAIGASLAVLRSMYLLGARFVSVTSLDCATPWAAASIKSHDYLVEQNSTNSLNDFGKSVLHEMNRLGMLVEISQLSEAAMVSALRSAKAPVLLMNSAPQSLCNSSNVALIPDRILSLLPDNGGVIMLNLERCGDRQLTVREAIKAINFVRKVAGVDHVALGGAPKSYAFLLAELARDRVWGNAAIKKLIGGNVVRILREVEASKNRMPLNEEWIPHELIESNSYCRYPES